MAPLFTLRIRHASAAWTTAKITFYALLSWKGSWVEERRGDRGEEGLSPSLGNNFSIKTTTSRAEAKGENAQRVNIKIVWGFVFMLIALSGHLTDSECVCGVCDVCEVGFV